mmetsp:Transcript_58766/g.97467  ORF Transcript_58766/g.97467 Transcript_58766/m.97467 type:complete len:320 (-) Transcript_58766:262-1221(-)
MGALIGDTAYADLHRPRRTCRIRHLLVALGGQVLVKPLVQAPFQVQNVLVPGLDQLVGRFEGAGLSAESPVFVRERLLALHADHGVQRAAQRAGHNDRVALLEPRPLTVRHEVRVALRGLHREPGHGQPLDVVHHPGAAHGPEQRDGHRPRGASAAVVLGHADVQQHGLAAEQAALHHLQGLLGADALQPDLRQSCVHHRPEGVGGPGLRDVLDPDLGHVVLDPAEVGPIPPHSSHHLHVLLLLLLLPGRCTAHERLLWGRRARRSPEVHHRAHDQTRQNAEPACVCEPWALLEALPCSCRGVFHRGAVTCTVHRGMGD